MLDDVDLILSLEDAKRTSVEVKEQQAEAEKTQAVVDEVGLLFQ